MKSDNIDKCFQKTKDKINKFLEKTKIWHNDNIKEWHEKNMINIKGFFGLLNTYVTREE